MLKEGNKLVIKDFEQSALDKVKDKELKRKRQEVFGYGPSEDMDDSDSDEEALLGAGVSQTINKRVNTGGQRDLSQKDIGKL